MPVRRSARALAAAAITVVLLVAAGCSHSVPPQSDFVKAMVQSGIPEAQAKCTAKAAYKILSKSELQDLIDRGASGIPKNDPDRTDDHADRLAIAMGKCQSLVTTEQTEPISPTTTTTTAVPTTTGASINTTAPTAPADGIGQTTTTGG